MCRELSSSCAAAGWNSSSGWINYPTRRARNMHRVPLSPHPLLAKHLLSNGCSRAGRIVLGMHLSKEPSLETGRMLQTVSLCAKDASLFGQKGFVRPFCRNNWIITHLLPASHAGGLGGSRAAMWGSQTTVASCRRSCREGGQGEQA